MAHPKFVVRKGRTGKFRFNLVGTNGKVIATSEPYNSRASALKGIEAVRRHALDADVLDDATAPKPGRSGARVGRSARRAGECGRLALRVGGKSWGRLPACRRTAPDCEAMAFNSQSELSTTGCCPRDMAGRIRR